MNDFSATFQWQALSKKESLQALWYEQILYKNHGKISLQRKKKKYISTTIYYNNTKQLEDSCFN